MLEWLLRKKTNTEIIINIENLETRVAVVEEGRLEEYQIEYATKQRIVGSIYKGVIQNLEHDLQAAFVDIGLKKNAFLHYWDMVPEDSSKLDIDEGDGNGNKGRGRGGRGRGGRGKGGRGKGGRGGGKGGGRSSRRSRYTNKEIEKNFPPGSEIIVQVTKDAISTKGPRVSANLSVPGRYIVLLPGGGPTGVSRKIADSSERGRLKKVLDRLPLPDDTGVIIRTNAEGASKRAFVRDLRGLLEIWTQIKTGREKEKAPACIYQEPELAERVVRDWLTEDIDRIMMDSKAHHERIRDVASRISRSARSRVQMYEGVIPIFEHFKIERQIEEATSRRVTLKSGGYIIFDETEALIAVDVNTGRHKGRGSQDEAILAVNTEAVEEVARQLRLRNIGGIVILDLIDMKSRKHQQSVYRTMKGALKRDKARTNVLPISDLGILEMTRQRFEESITTLMHADCPYCDGKGAVKSALGMSAEIQRQLAAIMRKQARRDNVGNLQVVVHPTVLDRLREEDEGFLVELQKEFEGHLSFKSDPAKHVEYFSISNPDTEDILYVRGER